MIKLYKPENEEELLFIKSILESDNIPCFVHNDHFGSLWVGPQIDLFNAKTIMVNEEHYERSKELIANYLGIVKEETETPKLQYSLFEKIRMVFEVLIISWFIPGKRRKKNKNIFL